MRLALFCLVVGILAGFAFDRVLRSEEADFEPTPATAHAEVREVIDPLPDLGHASSADLGILIARIEELNPSVLARAAESFRDQMGSIAKEAILIAWSEQTPRDAFIFALSQNDRGARMLDLSTVLDVWTRIDPERAWNHLSSLERPRRNEALSVWAETVALHRPELAFEQIATLSSADERRDLLKRLFENWSRHAPEAALAQLHTLPQGPAADAAWAGFLRARSNDTPLLAYEDLSRIEDPQLRLEATQAVLSRLAQIDLGAALKKVGLESSEARQKTLLDGIFTRSDPALAVEWALGNLSGRERDTMVGAAMESLAYRDAAAAADWLDAIPFGKTYDQTQQTIAEAWLQQDPLQALAWTDRMPPGYMTDFFRNRALRKLIENRPEEVLAIAAHSENPQEQARLYAAIALERARETPLETLDWIQSLPEETRSATRESTFEGWIQSDYQSFLEYQNAQSESIPITGRLAASLAYRWTLDNPENAANWAYALPVENGDRSALLTVLANWYANDPEDATQWVRAVPDGPNANYVLSNASFQLMHENPAEAFSLATEISDADRRRSSVYAVIETWAGFAPQRVREAIRGSGLSQSEQEAALAHIAE